MRLFPVCGCRLCIHEESAAADSASARVRGCVDFSGLVESAVADSILLGVFPSAAVLSKKSSDSVSKNYWFLKWS